MLKVIKELLEKVRTHRWRKGIMGGREREREQQQEQDDHGVRRRAEVGLIVVIHVIFPLPFQV